MDRHAEIRAAGRFAGDALARGVGLIADVHSAIAQRAFDGVGPAAEPVRAIHDSVSKAVYGSVRVAHAFAPRVGSTVAAMRTPNGPASDRPGKKSVLAALNGLWGDTLADRYPELAVQMSFRKDGKTVPVDGPGLAATFPDATSRIALLVHGLCETDGSWLHNAEEHWGDPSASYGSMLERDLGYTGVYLAYNSGLHVSDNGRQLSALLQQLVEAWPVGVEQIVLIGHSMGGLVIRSACHYAQGDGLSWPEMVTDVFCLGTPHLGAPLEKGVHTAAFLTSRLPETQPFAKLLDARSSGVKDLRFGALVEEDWSEVGTAEFLQDRCTEVPFLEGVTYYFVGVSVTKDVKHPVGVLVGDLLVRIPSASGKGRNRRIPFKIENGSHIGGLNHFDLLNHPDVYAQLHSWLSKRRARPALSVG